MYYRYKHLYCILYKLYFDKDVLKQECKKKKSKCGVTCCNLSSWEGKAGGPRLFSITYLVGG